MKHQKTFGRGTILVVALALAVAAPAVAAPAAEQPDVPSENPIRWDVETRMSLPDGVVGVSSMLPPLEIAPLVGTVESGVVDLKATLLGEGFEGSFPGATWTLFNLGVDAGWGKSTRRRSAGNASGWCAQTGTAAPAPGQNVRNNMESWMVAGPFDLSSVTSGDLSFDLFLDTETGIDTLWVGASTSFPTFNLFGRNVDTSGFERFSVDLESWGSLGDLTGQPAVWFAFLYTTDASVTFEGAYLDQIALNVDTSAGLNLLINQIDAADCPDMQAFVSVTDGQGNPISGLRSSNFRLSEDGGSRTVTSRPATGSGEALATTLVLDGSGSLSSADIANVKAASREFVDLLDAGDSVAVYHFGTNVTRVRDYTTSRNAIRNAIDALTNGLGSTSLYDAIVDAADHSRTVGGRRALLVMTDGQDNDSVASEQDAIDAAVAAGVPVFTIGFGSIDEAVLQRIATQTGGLFFRGADSNDLLAILNRIGQTLGQQYLLTWTADDLDGGSHPVTIEVRRQGLVASQTTTYSQAGTPCATAGVCTANDTTLCLNQGRFRVEVSWTDFNGNSGPGRVAPCGADDSGILYFFRDDNWEMLIKVLDGCRLNDRYWVFLAATTNVRYEVVVTDTRTNTRRRYTNPLGVSSPAVTDTAAFATCP